MPLIVIDGIDMMECDYCNFIWDGNAQCNCWGQIGIDDDDELYYAAGAGAGAHAVGYDSGYDSGYNE